MKRADIVRLLSVSDSQVYAVLCKEPEEEPT